MQKVLGLDVGEKRTGVSISDALGLMAHPYKTIQWKGLKRFLSEIKIIVNAENIHKIVVGLPLTLRGTESKKTEEVKKIIKALRESFEQEIIEVDERLTTKMAENALLAVGKKPSRNRDKIDQIAAVEILQLWLDKNQT
jgi:putative Holliday junction resolvase